jgi:hypothetical protein
MLLTATVATVAVSTMHAEYQACGAAAREGLSLGTWGLALIRFSNGWTCGNMV